MPGRGVSPIEAGNIYLSLVGLIGLGLAVSVVIAWRRHRRHVNRQAIALGRLRGLERMPGEITQAFPGPVGDHDADNTEGIPVHKILGRAVRGHHGQHRKVV